MISRVEWTPSLCVLLMTALLKQAERERRGEGLRAVLVRCLDKALALYDEFKDDNLMQIAMALADVIVDLDSGKTIEEIRSELDEEE